MIIIAFVALILLWFVFYFIPIGLWFSALVSGVRISLLQLVLMRFRKVPPSVIVNQLIAGTKAGLHLQANDLEAHFLAGGNVPNVVTALISAQKANIALDFKMAAAIDLAGRNVAEAVQMSVNPKVINTPPVAAVAKDGIQLIAKARVCGPISNNWSVEPVKIPCWHASAKVSFRRSVRPLRTKPCWKTLILFHVLCWKKDSTRERRLKSCRSTSPIST